VGLGKKKPGWNMRHESAIDKRDQSQVAAAIRCLRKEKKENGGEYRKAGGGGENGGVKSGRNKTETKTLPEGGEGGGRQTFGVGGGRRTIRLRIRAICGLLQHPPCRIKGG